MIGRGGKSTEQNMFHFNVCIKDNQKQGIYLERVEFEVIEDFESDNETVLFAQVPVNQHKKSGVNLAKERELQNLKNFSIYSEVEDEGQQTLSTRWVITEKLINDKVEYKARLVVRGFEEESKVQNDSPTAKSSLRVFFCHHIELKMEM